MLYVINCQSNSILSVIGNFVTTSGLEKKSNVAESVDKAYATFAEKYPNWVDAQFDQSFVDKKIKPIAQSQWKKGRTLSAVDVAMAWDAQFSQASYDRRQANMDELVSVAKNFVGDLNRNLTK
ncbi:MAG: hypothetical protein AAGD96_21050 [Chloroflexota bacterium]